MGNAFLVKGLVDLIRYSIEEGDWTAFTNVTPYFLLLGAVSCSILGTFFMQSGLRQYKGIYMVTIFEGAHITFACLSGAIVMREMSESVWTDWLAYWSSVGCII